ncbi:MAG: glycosyltransferase [Clostridia bacterium]|nr:glycosyltransferase [Clostridia bacterium]
MISQMKSLTGVTEIEERRMQTGIKSVVFVSNFLNHHQIPLCEAFAARCKDFRFVATDIAGRGGYTGGYQKSTEKEYVVHYNTEKDQAMDLIMNADAVIFGVCPTEMIINRTNAGKLSFIYSESFFRHSKLRVFIPTTMRSIYNRALRFKNKNFYVLCASAYLPHDLSFFRFPENKCFKWGYFPEIKRYDDIDVLIDRKNEKSIIWVGRFLKLKHPEVPVLVAKRLKEAGFRFSLKMIGDGETRIEIERLVKKYSLSECVEFLGSKTPEEVRSYMEQSEVFLFTSDKQEGWGAVLNEAMNSCCAVVACNAIGSVPFLIENGANGYQYTHRHIDEVFEKVKFIFDNPEKRKDIGKNAYETLAGQWCADIAAERFLQLSEELSFKKDVDRLFKNGPCSKAEVIKR